MVQTKKVLIGALNFRLVLVGISLIVFYLPVFSQDLVITANYSDSNLSEILLDIQSRYPVRFFYKHEWLPKDEINIQLNRQPLTTALEKILEDSDLSYIIYGNDKIIIAQRDRIGNLQSNNYFITKQVMLTNSTDSRFPVLVVGDSTRISEGSSNRVILNVVDKNESQKLDGVSVYIEQLEQTVNSNFQGEVRFSLPVGMYQLEARRISYEPFICYIKVYSDGVTTLQMEQEAIELEEVVVSGQGPEQRLMNPQTGVVTLTPRQIKEMPVFLGEADVVKTILTVPGITTIGEGTAGFFVRGGNIDQNLILQDEVLFSNSSHALGFFSLFNPDLISNLQLYKGNIPAQYGGRLSSVLDVQLKGNNYSTTSINGSIGTVMSKLSIETPLIKDKINIVTGGRISYADWFLPVIKIPEIQESKAFFYDFNMKISARLSETGSVNAGYFQSFDRINFGNEAGFDWTIKNLSLGWDQQLGKVLQSEFKAVAGTTDNLNYDPSGLVITELKNGLDFYKIKENIRIPLENHQLVVGGEWINYQPQDEVLSVTGSSEPENSLPRDQGTELGLYINNDWEVNDNLALSAGIRASLFNGGERGDETDTRESYNNLEPRLSVRLGLGNASSVKASYNRMNQYIHLLSNTTGVLPIDQWIVSNSIIRPSKSDGFSIGYFRNFKADAWESSAEIFYKRMTDLIEFRDFADLVLNPDLYQEIIQGDGKAYGMEIFIKRHQGKIKGNLSYTYSRSFIKAPLKAESIELNWFPAKFDRPHNLNLVMDWTVNRRSKFGLVFNFTSGRPITAPVSSYSLGNVVVPHYSDRNEYRIPGYHRLDLSYTYRRNAVKKKRYQDSITFSIYNIYGRRNAFSVFFRKENNQPAKAFRLSVLGSAFPSVTYTFEFK